MCEPFRDKFYNTDSCENIVNQLTCYKNPKNHSRIDMILTNKQEKFLKTRAVETRLPDFHEMLVTGFQTGFTIKKPTIVTRSAYEIYCENLRKNKYNQKYINYK